MKELLKFVKEFNDGVENLNEYTAMDYMTDGNVEALRLPETILWNCDTDHKYAKKIALVQIMRFTSAWKEVAESMLDDEINIWSQEFGKRFLEKFPKARFKISKKSSIIFLMETFGEYDEDLMFEFLEGEVEDFEYAFQEAEIDIVI